MLYPILDKCAEQIEYNQICLAAFAFISQEVSFMVMCCH